MNRLVVHALVGVRHCQSHHCVERLRIELVCLLQRQNSRAFLFILGLHHSESRPRLLVGQILLTSGFQRQSNKCQWLAALLQLLSQLQWICVVQILILRLELVLGRRSRALVEIRL